MAVTVKVPRIMRDRVGGAATVEIGADGTRTLRDLIETLDQRYPGMKQGIVDDRGELHRFVNLYVDGEDVRYLESLETKVADDATVAILPAVAGG